MMGKGSHTVTKTPLQETIREKSLKATTHKRKELKFCKEDRADGH